LQQLRAPAAVGKSARSQCSVKQVSPGDVKQRSIEVDKRRMEQLREHGLKRERAQGNPFREFVLPCGNVSSTTTSLSLSVRYGKVVHICVMYRDLTELQSLAFEYVALRRSQETLGREDKNKTALAYATYKMITTGDPVDQHAYALLDAKDEHLPESQEAVEVCAQLKRTADLRREVYIGPGDSLVVDRLAMHDQLVRMMNHKDDALALAFRHVALYYPSAMLEGGGGLVDLPGLNAASVIEQLETRNGVTASSTGAVVVVLDKDLSAALEVQRKLEEFGVLRQALGGGHAARKHVIFVYNCTRPLSGLMPRACAQCVMRPLLAECDLRSRL
jgi:hypothetical protein